VLLAGAASGRAYAANEKLNVALIGCGGRGTTFVNSMPKAENVVALCDVSEKKATVAFRKFPDLPKFADYRVMLAKMGKEIDAVSSPPPTTATPRPPPRPSARGSTSTSRSR